MVGLWFMVVSSSGCLCGVVTVRRRVVRAEVRPGAGVWDGAEERYRTERHRVREGVHVGAGAAVCRVRAPPPQPRPESGVHPLLPEHQEVEAPAPRRTLVRYALIAESLLDLSLSFIVKKQTHLFHIDDVVRSQENIYFLFYILKLADVVNQELFYH